MERHRTDFPRRLNISGKVFMDFWSSGAYYRFVMPRKTEPKLTDAERHKRFVAMAKEVGASDDPKDFEKAFAQGQVYSSGPAKKREPRSKSVATCPRNWPRSAMILHHHFRFVLTAFSDGLFHRAAIAAGIIGKQVGHLDRAAIIFRDEANRLHHVF